MVAAIGTARPHRRAPAADNSDPTILLWYDARQIDSSRLIGRRRSVTGPVITVATMKGGSGKSTLASCLAVHWQLAGRHPTIIDADPQRSIARLAARERALGGVTVVEDASPDA